MQRAARSAQQATENVQHACDMQQATGNIQHAASNRKRETRVKHACDMQQAAGNIQHAAGNMQDATCSTHSTGACQPANSTRHTTCHRGHNAEQPRAPAKSECRRSSSGEVTRRSFGSADFSTGTCFAAAANAAVPGPCRARAGPGQCCVRPGQCRVGPGQCRASAVPLPCGSRMGRRAQIGLRMRSAAVDTRCVPQERAQATARPSLVGL
jgi:uncharacterized protein YjbJ (UPF0337 family)